jgi:ribonucleotide monophosphatase NagD (HAD superfamily)
MEVTMDNKIDTILFDLDGTLYTNGKPIKTSIDSVNIL